MVRRLRHSRVVFARVKEHRTDKGAGGGGRLEFGRFRESVEQAMKDAGWTFVFDVA